MVYRDWSGTYCQGETVPIAVFEALGAISPTTVLHYNHSSFGLRIIIVFVVLIYKKLKGILSQKDGSS